MPAVSESTVPVTPRTTAVTSANAQTVAELLPATDTLWADVYHVIALLREADGAQWWKAHRTDTAEEVLLRVMPGAKDDARAEVWERLCALDVPHLQRAREVLFAAGHRVEVSEALRGTSLAAWRAARAEVEPAVVELLVRDVAGALGALHASGLVHTGLRPEVIFVREDQDGPSFSVGGLESAIRFEGDAVALTIDPRYAPPEAVGLERHERGMALCAWDWWALGRIVQEMLLGHHVAAQLPETAPGESVAARAETLLWERDPAGPRAGAVEIMPPMDARAHSLLRGLLASAPERRWNGDFLDRWLRRMPVKDEYEARRIDKRFRWRGRLWEVPAAANELRSATLWPEAARHVTERATHGTLANFLARSPEHKKQREQLDETLKLIEAEPLRSLPADLARDIVTAVALLQLAEGGLVLCGQRLDGANLGVVLAEGAASPARLAVARALTHRNITNVIERHDFKLGRSLTDVARVAADAESFLRRAGWLKAADAAESERIFRRALEPDAALHAAGVEPLRRDFASASQPAVEKILQGAQPSRAELVALAWVAPHAAQCGFVTHAAWQTQRAGELRARAGGIATALAWTRLGRALGAAPLVYGGWPTFIAVWGIVAGVFAVVWPGAKWLPLALLPGALAGVLRFVGALSASGTLRRFASAADPWSWRDGAVRCAYELDGSKETRDAAGLERAMTEIESEISKLPLAKSAARIATPEFAAVRGFGVAGWVVLSAALAMCAWRGVTHPPSRAELSAAWLPDAASGPTNTGDVKVSWPYRPGTDAPTLNIPSMRPVTRAEKAAILERGRALVAPYRPETIATSVIFRLVKEGKVEVAIFDGRKGAPVNDNLYALDYLPLARAWIEVAGQKGIFLDP